MKIVYKAMMALLSFFVMVFCIGGGFILLRHNIDVPAFAFVGAAAGVISIVAAASTFSSWLHGRRG